jgi:hypothetical protein
MNKKFAILMLMPLMLIPLVSFGYSHFYAYVWKRYAIHVGSVEVEVIYFHIDYLKMIDVNNNGVIIGDEFQYRIDFDPTTRLWFVDMIADPIPSGFVLNTTLKIHISGKLPVRFNFGEAPAGGQWAGPFENAFPEGMWDNTSLTWNPINTLPGLADPLYGPWSYAMSVYKENLTHGVTGPYLSTQTEYKPSNNITIYQHLDFRQPSALDQYDPHYWQCHRILIRWYFQFIEETPQELSSTTWINPNYTGPVV